MGDVQRLCVCGLEIDDGEVENAAGEMWCRTLKLAVVRYAKIWECCEMESLPVEP